MIRTPVRASPRHIHDSDYTITDVYEKTGYIIIQINIGIEYSLNRVYGFKRASENYTQERLFISFIN